MARLINGAKRNNDGDIFSELATSLFYFTEKLYEALVDQHIEDIYFMSREGQPLMRMFNMYQKRVNGNITPHYLEVSRRSTLLPSLAPLADENFETLFRQYRCISLLEFLSSLGLEKYAKKISRSLALTNGAERQRQQDFPTSPIFSALIALPDFEVLYESERIARHKAFLAYLSDLSGTHLPHELTVVDVGWKGTIQDNLYALLCRNHNTPVHTLAGYYVGLVAEGAACSRNKKYGLLFSSVGETTPKFHIFNENRALFEILLAANHGSIIGYEFKPDGHAYPIQGPFDEHDMLATRVFPVQRQVFQNFERILETIPNSVMRRPIPFKEAVRAHSRMVFRPTSRERIWFSSVFHVENYGVFERSRFTSPEKMPGIAQRLRFVKRAFLNHDPGTLGFWPYLTLYNKVGALFAAIYAAIRRLQP